MLLIFSWKASPDKWFINTKWSIYSCSKMSQILFSFTLFLYWWYVVFPDYEWYFYAPWIFMAVIISTYGIPPHSNDRKKELGSVYSLPIKLIKMFCKMVKHDNAVNWKQLITRRNVCAHLVLHWTFTVAIKQHPFVTANSEFCSILLLSPLICLCACSLLLEGLSSSLLWEAVTVVQECSRIAVWMLSSPFHRQY